jgi:enoyl-CoA hydratase/carnithine racemase
LDGSETILYEKRGRVAWLTLNRPQVLNAVNMRMRDELWTAMQAVRDDPTVAAVIIKGAGERAFSAGADISEFGTSPSYVEARRARRERDLWQLMLDVDKPLIAAIHGFALGAGCEMSMCCDIRIAAEDARFGLPEVSLGYIPSAGGTQLLPRTVPAGVAMDMILSGREIDAAEALRLGLVNTVVARDRLYEEAEEWAERLISRPPLALAYAKEALTKGIELPLAEGLALEQRLAVLVLASAGAAPRLREYGERQAAGFRR